MTEAESEALVEIARLVRDRLEDGGGCVYGPDWDWDVDECAKVADDVARAILPILAAREAAAEAKGRREAYLEAAEWTGSTDDFIQCRSCYEHFSALAEKQP